VVMLGPVRRKRRVLPLAVLVLLVAVNAFLIALLLRSQSEVTAEPTGQLTIGSTSPTEPAASGPAQGASPSVSSTPEPSSSPSTDQEVAVPTRLLLATSPKKAWRATVGDCQKAGRIERSVNGGKSWKRTVDPALGPLVRLGVESNGSLYTVGGAGEGCSVRYIAYAPDGAIEAQTGRPKGIWFRLPKDVDQIQGPGSGRAAPCKGEHVVGLASISTSEALVTCTDGSVMVTSDSGKSWDLADELDGAMAVGAGGGRFWAAGKGKNCDGVAIRSFSLSAGKLSRGRSRCAAELAATPDQIAIDVSGNAIWLWADNKVQVSTDGGRTWS
jgi:hypothetical protein